MVSGGRNILHHWKQSTEHTTDWNDLISGNAATHKDTKDINGHCSGVTV